MTVIAVSRQLVTLENSSSDPLTRVAIVNHIMAGYMAGTFARFNNPSEEVSAHFGISRKGEIVQYVDLSRWAYANGIIENPDLSIKWLLACIIGKENPNRKTISIEHEGFSSGPVDSGLTEAQYNSSLALHRYLMEKFPSILPDRQHILGHYQITGLSRANCPGPLFPYNRLIGDLKMSFKTIPGNFIVPGLFTAFWWNNGGLPIFGYPIGPLITDPAGFPNLGAIQWFERARFEVQLDGSITLGLLGSEIINSGSGRL